jgi:hypothetical protein
MNWCMRIKKLLGVSYAEVLIVSLFWTWSGLLRTVPNVRVSRLFSFRHEPQFREFVTMEYYLTVRVLDTIHRPVLCLKHDFSETGFCPLLQMEPTQLGPIARTSLCLRTGSALPNHIFRMLATILPLRYSFYFDLHKILYAYSWVWRCIRRISRVS